MKNPSHPQRIKSCFTRALALAVLALSPTAARAEVKLTFDTTAQNFSVGGDGSSVQWVNDPTFGGCLKVVFVNAEAGNEGYKPNGALIDIYAAGNEDLRAELAAAANLGGTLKFTAHVRTADLVGTTPGYTPGYYGIGYLVNAQSGYTVDFTNYIGGYQPGGTITTTIQVPIVAVGAGGGIGNSILEYFPGSGYNQLSIGVNTSKFNDGFLGSTLYIDDFTVTANTVAVPPPTLQIAKATTGLHMVSSDAGQYARQCIRTVTGQDMSWVGKATALNPVSYAWTIKESPPGAGYESLMYLIPGNTLGANDSAPDYSQPDGIQLQVYPNGDGSASMSFRYKVNSPNSNGPPGREYYLADLGDGIGGQITAVNSTKLLGTWKCTFTSDLDFTLTAPDGTTSTAAIHPSIVDDFTGPMYVYFGNLPSQTPNIGLSAVYSRAQVTGTPNDFDEDFSTIPFNSNLEVAASVPASVFQVTPDVAKFFLNWTFPYSGYTLKQSTDLGVTSAWEDLPYSGVMVTKYGRSMLLTLPSVLSETKDFIRMEKPATP